MSAYHYNAFISYRRTAHDMAVAKEVQHSLERFRVPAAIRRATGRENINRIFRDQEELAITSDLSGRIEAALEASEYLIVICSPGYTESAWCLKELETFLRLRGPERVLCVLSEGEPPFVFPDILLHRTEELTAEDGSRVTVEVRKEPLACDYRGDFRKARRTELPRLAAVLLGCGYDELVMRRERYRRRRLAGIFSGAAVLAIAAISYLLWSNAQISRSYRASQISESRLLAMKSLDAFDEQDRYLALNAALEALTGGGERPVTDEAQYALSQASFAYFTPYHWLETWRVDDVNDITAFFLSRDQKTLVCMDRTGRFRSFALETREELCSFRAAENTVPVTPIEGRDGELLCYDGANVVSVNYMNGRVNWKLPLKYQRIGGVARSGDGAFIAAADSFAVQILTAEGEPYLSLPLPEDSPGYITELLWSPDDSRIAVKLKLSGESAYGVGVFRVDTSEYYPPREYTRTVDLFQFDPENVLYLLGGAQDGASMRVGGTTVLTANSCAFTAIRDGETLWTRQVSAAKLSETCSLHVRRQPAKRITLAVGSRIFIFDAGGESLGEMDTRRDILTLMNADEAGVSLITWDGELGTVYPDTGNSVMERFFPAELDRVEVVDGGSVADLGYIVLHDGDLGIYEGVWDENVSVFDGEGSLTRPDGYLRSGNQLMLMTDGAFRFYRLDTREQTAVLTPDAGKAWHPLTTTGNTAYLLGVSGEDGIFSILTLDLESGQALREERLEAYDYFVRSGLLHAPFTQGDRMYLDSFYASVSPVAVQGNRVYLHDREDCNRIRIVNLESLETETLDLSPALGETRMLVYEETSFPLPSPLAVSPDGALIFSAYTDLNDGSRHAVLIRVEDGVMTELPGEPDDLSSVAFTQDGIIYAGARELYVCGTDGELRRTIPFTGDNAISFAWNRGRLYCVFPDGTLAVYGEDGEVIRTVPLSFNLSMDIISGKDFHYEFTPTRLYLSCGGVMNAVMLDSNGETAVYYADSVVTHFSDREELLVCGYDPERTAQSGDMRCYPGVFREYSVEELIARAREQLEQYEPF